MYLDLEDTRLYYEVRGSGPALLLIHGVVVDAWLYERTAQLLARHFRVITYDRRGVSRSVSKAGARFDMDAQVSDALALLDALGIERAAICGASAGAIVGIGVLRCAPARVERLVLYEPPFASLLEDGAAWVAEMKDLIKRRRFNTATLHFLESIGEPDPRAEEKPQEVSLREMGNLSHFLQAEFSVFMDEKPDFALCRQYQDKVIVAIGDRGSELPYARGARLFAEQVGIKPVYFPGGHNCPSELPREFAVNLLGTLLL